MEKTSKWSLRQMQCPEGKGKAELLLEWRTEKGRKVLQGISCDNPELLHYSGMDCQWRCIEKISGKKK